MTKSIKAAENIGFPLPFPVKCALEMLYAQGFEAYCVGGCVRDHLMGIPPHDFDITTSAMPEETVKCFSDYRVIETGLKHGTVTVIIDGEQLEITTFRTDGTYSDNRHPDNVTFTRSLDEDLSRRDFTVNAMAFSPVAGLCDPFGGSEDLKRKTIRCVGEADRRFGEDALRILRALRFSSVLGFEIEQDTSEAIFRKMPLPEKISKERIYTELTKLICGDGASRILREYRKVFDFILPPLSSVENDVYGADAESLNRHKKDRFIRYAALFNHIGSDADESATAASRLLRFLHADNKTADTVNFLIRKLPEVPTDDDKIKIKRFVASCSFEAALLAVEFARGASKISHNTAKDICEAITRLQNENECLFIKDLAVSGSELMDIGIQKGQNIGKILNRLISMVIDGEIQNEKETLLREAERLNKEL